MQMSTQLISGSLFQARGSLGGRLKDTRFKSRSLTWASLKHAVAMEDMLKMMGIEAGSKSKSPADKHGNAIKVKKKKEGSSDGSAMDSQVSVHEMSLDQFWQNLVPLWHPLKDSTLHFGCRRSASSRRSRRGSGGRRRRSGRRPLQRSWSGTAATRTA